MGLLAAHPAIATPRVFPFEERIASYYGDVFRAITRTGAAKAGLPHYFGAAHRSYPSNDLLKPGLLRRIDQNGRFEVTSGLIAQSANAARTLVDVIYSGFTGTTLEQTPIFAEKMIGYFSTQEILSSLYDDMHEIILVRDFRDAFTSAMMFNRKRHSSDFGAERSSSDTEWVGNFANDAKEVMHAARQRPNAKIVKYEDLVSDPSLVLKQISSWIGVAATLDVISTCIESFGKSNHDYHKTSGSSEDLISRWRRDLDPALAELADERMQEPLSFFGYS